LINLDSINEIEKEMDSLIIKHRSEPGELKLLRCLDNRMELPDKDQSQLFSLEKGYEGELKFDGYLGDPSQGWYILKDLLLESGNSIFQIDSLLIKPEKVIFFEIKNFDGDYMIENDRWTKVSTGKDIKNPIFQKERAEILFRGLLQELGFQLQVESYVIFINPKFFLYQAPLNPSLIFPSQIHGFLNKVSNRPFQKNKFLKLAEQLASLHITKSPYTRLPVYQYEQLRKGVTCANCHSFLESTDPRDTAIICKKCGLVESTHSAILRSIEEFQLLFPDRKITVNGIYEWCDGIKSKKVIRSVLLKNFELVRYGKGSYYLPR
jgi:hypothetical protein